MKYDLDNLDVQWVEKPEERWVDDLESMVEGYPFEKGRREQLGEDRLERIRATWESGDSALLAAYFGPKLVGWLQLNPDDLLSEHLPAPYVRARFELVQRNRDDVRHHLLEAVRERYPEAIVELRQPTQNRTARSYLLGQPDVVAGSTTVHLTRTDDRSETPAEVEDGTIRRDPGSLPELENLLSTDGNDLIPEPVKEDLQRKEYLENLLDDYANDPDRKLLALVQGDVTRTVLLLDERPNGSGDPILAARILTESNAPEGLGDLLAAAEERSGTVEVRIDSQRQGLFETLRGEGYEPLTKRMILHRLPPALTAGTEGAEPERTRP